MHMSDSEVTSDFAGVLQKVRQGVEVIVEKDCRPVASIRSAPRSGRLISECIASARASSSQVTLDHGFTRDVEEGIKGHQEPWIPPFWD